MVTLLVTYWPRGLMLDQIRCTTTTTSERMASHQDTDPITMKNDFAPEHHFTITGPTLHLQLLFIIFYVDR